MEVIEELSPEDATSAAVPAGCPRCGEAWGSLPPVVTRLFRQAPLRRCGRCGARFTAGEPPYRRLRTCDRCDMPFLDAESGAQERTRCPDCLGGRVPDAITDATVAGAAETEIQDALRCRGPWIASPRLAPYLARLLSAIGDAMAQGPRCARIGLIDDPAPWTLALPSGALLLSRGLLAFVQDEAELVFILARAWSHAASSDASARLARRGLLALARDDAPEGGGRAAADLLRLGYGRTLERRADLRATRVMRELGYDAEAIVRLLQRLERRMRQGDPSVAEYALAHPPPAERLRHIEEHLRGNIESDGRARVNREVFRRVAGPAVLDRELRPVDAPTNLDDDATAPRRWPLTGPVGWWVLFGLLVILGLLLIR